MLSDRHADLRHEVRRKPKPEFLRFTVRLVGCAAALAVLFGLGGTRMSWIAAPADGQRHTSEWPWLFLGLSAAGAAALYAVGLTRQAVGLAVLLTTIALAVLLAQAGPGNASSIGARRISMPLLLVVTASAVPWGRYALDMVVAAREGRDPVDVTSGFDHWSMQAALGFSVLVVAALAALYLPGWRVPAWTAGTAASALGAFSMGYPSHAGSLGSDWGAAAAVWGLLVIALAEVSARFGSRATPAAHMNR